MESFISFVICTILVLYALGYFGRIALGYYIRKKQREFQQQFGSASNHTRDNQSSSSSYKDGAKKQEGSIHVQQSTNTEKRVSRNVGEYVDFEEMK